MRFIIVYSILGVLGLPLAYYFLVFQTDSFYLLVLDIFLLVC